jgi:Domain of unknown function (DUF4384)
MRTPYAVGLGLLMAGLVSAQQQPQLKARELFYTPIPDSKPAPAKENPEKESAKIAPPKSSKPKQAQSTKDTSETVSQAPKKSPDGTRVQNASNSGGQVVGPPLALKYRLLKRSPDGPYDEVDTDTIFKSGDKIRVSVESNDAAYLYIVQQGSSKTWNVLFPNDETEQGSNHIQRNREYEIPGGGRFTFDEQAGSEKMFIILTRRPEPDLEKLIYSLSKGASVPASGEKTGETPKLMVAQSRIDDSLIARLRGGVLSRDLVFEKVNDDGPVNSSGGKRKEKAMYVATNDRSPNARIVVDLSLNHQ